VCMFCEFFGNRIWYLKTLAWHKEKREEEERHRGERQKGSEGGREGGTGMEFCLSSFRKLLWS
jgi:hypothetical protein